MKRLLGWKENIPYDGPDSNGRARCRQCGKALHGRRTAWCFDDCRIEFKIPRDWTVATYYANRRDKGFCALCGRDGEALVMRFHELGMASQTRISEAESLIIKTAQYALVQELNHAGFFICHRDLPYPKRGLFWQIDHILPVVEGGGGCGLDNLRTLCSPCHKRETAALAARRFKRKAS